jgi:hypothetical protein
MSAMNDTERMYQNEEELLCYEVSDGALEAAAGSMKDRPVAATISFCSGLDTCPA